MLKRLLSWLGFSSIGIMIWGVLLSLPIDTFSTTPSYRSMATLFSQFGVTTNLSEAIWGIFLLSVGIVRISALLTGKHRPLVITSYLGCAVWIFLAVMLALANPGSTGGYIYALIAFYDAAYITKLEQGWG